MYAIGIDIGGTKIAGALISLDGNISEMNRVPSPASSAANISWRSEPLREKLQARIGSNIVIENDANAAGWAEYRFGAGHGYTHMTMLTSGTGVGGAALLDPVRASFQREMSARGFHPEPDFAIAELVNDAGVVGAADLARERSRLD
ncbi:MAG: ROK family protein [Actinobacteria bacterium]|nr:ROK family protein [Actinomycetota bacterium]